MKAVWIFRHSPTEGPGYFAHFLDHHAIPWRLIAIDAGDPVPDSIEGASGLCFMGGPMSVNDPLPWIPPVLERIREAVAARVPVIGHCLGGQLMARALGAHVTANRVKEIGWGALEVTDPEAARPWVGDPGGALPGFHWHGETFSLPPGARRLLKSAWCDNQAYVIDDLHLGMQCHVEMTPELVRSWCKHGAAEIAAADSPAVQTPVAIQTDLEARCAALHALADKIYSRWIQGLAR